MVFLCHPVSVLLCDISVPPCIRSHLVTVASGPRLSDALISSPIIVEDGAVPGAGFEFGIDPNEDPELALVSFFIPQFIFCEPFFSDYSLLNCRGIFAPTA